MKKLKIVSAGLLMIAVMFFAFTQSNQDKSLARVHRVQGKYVYVMCEPVCDYLLVDQVNTKLSQLIGTSPNIDKMVKELVEKAIDKEKRGKIEKFEGMITEDGEIGTLIKFTE